MKKILTWTVTIVVLVSGCRSEPGFYQNLLRSEVFYQSYSNSKVDFVWVLDDSASMATLRTTLASQMGTFIARMNQRKALDFRMVFTTTNFFSQNGALSQSGTGQKVVTSASSNPQAEVTAIVSTITSDLFSFWEQPLEQSRAAIENNKALFLRDEAELIVVYVTDEEDSSCKSSCFGVEPEHNKDAVMYGVGRYTSYLKNLKKGTNASVSVFPIVGSPGDGCSASWGVRMMTVARNIGGVSRIGNVCGANFSSSLDAMAATIGDRGARFPLQSTASGKGVRVSVNGVEVAYSDTNGFTYDNADNSIVFNGTAIPPNNAVIVVSYFEKTN